MKTDKKIKAIEKGWGEGCTFFSTNQKTSKDHYVEEIKEEGKQISNDIIINVYRGYLGGKIMFEMGASIDVTVYYNLEE